MTQRFSVLYADQQENEIAEYFEKTKSEILNGRKICNLSTPADALLTLISAYHHEDKITLEQIFPIVKQKQFERLSSPEVRSRMLAAAQNSILCRIEIEDKVPEESDLCAIYTRPSPEKPIDQVWSFAYISGAWRFAGSTSSTDNWRAQAEQAEAMTRNILQSEAAETKTEATNTPQQNANKIEGKWQATLTEFNQMYVMRFWRNPDGSLAGAATRNSPDDRPFNRVTFEDGKLRFQEKTNQGVFEGAMKEDGLTIEGKWQKPGMLTPCILKRVDDVSEQVQGAPKSEESTGNRVLSLDGEGDYVRIADSESLRSFSDAITIEVWFKASSFYPENGMVNSIVRKNVKANAENFFLRFRNVAGGPSVEMSVGYDNEVLQVPYNFAVDAWYHLAGTYNRSAITIFVNGLSIKSEIASGTLYIDESDLYIGKGDPEFSLGEFFHGTLDEIRIWNIARSPEEILAVMNSQLTGKEDGLVVYLNFDDSTAKDLSGHGNDGLLYGDALIIESSHPVTSASEEEEPAKLVSWWKFEDNVNDSAGANSGTINGNPTFVDGKFGRAISLDGDDYVDFGNPDSLNFRTGDWAVSAWIKTTQAGTNQDDASMNRGTVFANGGDEAGGIRYALAVNEGQLGSITLTTDDDEYKIQAIGKTAVNDGAWHHVVGMRKAGQLHLYIDGVLDGGSYLSAGYDLSGTSQHNAYIGVIVDNRDGSLYKYFVGLIDEVCIFAGAMDANGVRALYSGEDPVTVAKTALIRPKVQPRPVSSGDASGNIEGDWRIESVQVSQQAMVEIRKKPDGALTGAIVAEVSDEDSSTILLDEVTFENGRLYFEAPTRQTIFDGTMKQDGSTIQGSFQQQGQMIAVVLKRVVAPSEMATIGQEQLQDMKGGTSNIVTALILILSLTGLVGGIVFFFVKSSIRK
jgi:hypothetical protein